MLEQIMEKLNVEARRAEAEAQRQRAKRTPVSLPHVNLRRGDARDLSWIPDKSVHLIVTSPPYWTLKDYNDHPDQLGHVEDYEQFLDELDKVLVGRRIWIVHKERKELGMSQIIVDHVVAKLRRFLPAGPVAEADGERRIETGGIRPDHLIQFWSERVVDKKSGIEINASLVTAAVADIRLKDPGRVRAA